MDALELLTQAIQERKPVSGRYDGLRREFCPHAIGSKRGQRHTLVYQFGGGSGSGLPPEGEWRCLRLDELEDLQMGDGPWRSAPNLFNPQSCLDEIDLVVQPLPSRSEAGDLRSLHGKHQG